MNLTLIFITFIVIFVSYFQIYTRSQVINVMRRRVSGLDELASLRKLIEYIPQHRGMANAFLLGDQTFRIKLDELDKKIDNEINNILQKSISNDVWNILVQIETIDKNWMSIKNNLSKLKPAESFSLHTSLVKKIFYVINDLGDSANILTTQDSMYAKLADVVFLQLPIMTEMMGQARGMGTGIATKGMCDTNMRVKLTYLLNNTRKVANSVCLKVKDTLSNNSELNHQASGVLKDNQKATQRFLNLLDNNIINTRSIELSSTEYYDAGTEAIQLAFSLMDKVTLFMLHDLKVIINKLSISLIITKILASSISLSLLGILLY